MADLEQALAFEPPHLSHYQLTIEPNTVFAARPPPLPDDEEAWDIQEACGERLGKAGFSSYEISAWSQPGRASQHNLNYWRFGDYLGIGAGAHGKITLPAEQQVIRLRRKSHPRPYLNSLDDGSFIAEQWPVSGNELPFEYFLNRFRLAEPVPLAEFQSRTGLEPEVIAEPLNQAQKLGLIELTETHIHRTERGARYLNDLQKLFLNPEP